MPNTYSYRVVRDDHHLLLLNRLQWAYTTSANLSNFSYDENFAKEASDVIISPLDEKQKSSNIYKLGNYAIKRIR
jgi:hypothetical protein